MIYKARDELENVKPYIPGKPIEEVARELGIIGDIAKLASNENPLGTSPLAIEEIKKNLHKLNYYPDDMAFYLKCEIAKRNNIETNKIICSNGSAELIFVSVLSHINPGSNLIMGWPGFVIPRIANSIMGGETILVETDKNFYHNVENILSKINDKTKIVYLDNPTNPLGTFLDSEKISYLLKNIPSHILFILDQAYNEYLNEDNLHSAEQLLKERENILILRTFSKIYGLSGLRIGYGLSNSKVIKNLSKVKIPFNVNSLAQKAALAALFDFEFLKKSKQHNKCEIEFLKEEFKKREFNIIDTFTNFITFDIEKDTKEFNCLMQKEGVIIRPLVPYGLKTMIRVSVGKRENNEKFFKALDKVYFK